MIALEDAEREALEERRRAERLRELLAGDEELSHAALPPATRASLSRRFRRLDPALLAQRRAPGPDPARPDEGDRPARAGVARGGPGLVLPHAGGEVLRGPGVERAVAAAQDVDEGQRLLLRSARPRIVDERERPCAMPVPWEDPLTVNAGYEYREEVGPEAAGRTVLAWLVARYRHSTEADLARRASPPARCGSTARPPWRWTCCGPASRSSGSGRRGRSRRCRSASRSSTATRTCWPSPSRAACPRSRTAASSSTRCSSACAACTRRPCRCTGSAAAPRASCSSRGRPGRGARSRRSGARGGSRRSTGRS